MEHRFEKRFASLQARHEGGFMPFVTLCDPDKETSLKILHHLSPARVNKAVNIDGYAHMQADHLIEHYQDGRRHFLLFRKIKDKTLSIYKLHAFGELCGKRHTHRTATAVSYKEIHRATYVITHKHMQDVALFKFVSLV